MTTARLPVLGLGALSTLAVVVLVVAAGWAGAATPPPTELAGFDPGGFVRWGLPFARFAGTGAAIVATGTLLGLLLLASRTNVVDQPAEATAATLRRWVSGLAVTAAVAQVLQVILAISSAAGRPVLAVPADEFWECLVLTSNLYCLAGAAGFLCLAAAVRTALAGPHLLLLALVATAVPFVGGHSSSAPHHTLSVGLMVVHVLAASLWVGGVAALLLVGVVLRDLLALRLMLPAFSRLAVRCAITIVLTGLASAVVRAPDQGQYSSTYLVLLATKAVAFVGLCCFGAWHRRHGVGAPRRGSEATDAAFLRTASAEVSLMVVLVAVATVLSQTAPEALG